MLTFLLAPLVGYIERWIGRIAAVLIVVAILFSVVGGAGWLLTRQLIDLAAIRPCALPPRWKLACPTMFGPWTG